MLELACPFDDQSFDAVISIDVMCHLPNRADILREWHRVTAPSARVLFTDPTIVTGLVTDVEFATRSAVGIYVFSAQSVNEELLSRALDSKSSAAKRPDREHGLDGRSLARCPRAIP